MYAQQTKVPVFQSRVEIERLLQKHGAQRFMVGSDEARAVIVFELKDRRLKFEVALPRLPNQQRTEKRHRQRWRALLLAIKAKLECVQSGIETFDEAFLAHVVMPDGMTVGEHTRGAITRAYETGNMQPLLPAPGAK